MTGKAVPIVLTSEERSTLERMVAEGTRNPLEARRARIILECANPDRTNTDIALEFGIERPIITNWRKRFSINRVAGLCDLPRAGRTATITQEVKDNIVALTLHSFPDDAPSWTLRLMGEKVGLSHTAVAKIWKEAGIKREMLPVKPSESLPPEPEPERSPHGTYRKFVRAMKKGTRR